MRRIKLNYDKPNYYPGGKIGQHRYSAQATHNSPNQTSSAGGGAALVARLTTFFPGPDFPVEDAGISAGEIVGHRCWLVDPNGLLGSMSFRYEWTPRGVESFPGKILPVIYGGGFHAFKRGDYEGVHGEYGGPSVYGVIVAGRRARVFGTVYLWGELIEHEGGYRAQYAAIRSIDSGIDLDHPGRLDEIRKLYGVEHEDKA